MSIDIELLPCPFCGGAARIHSNNDWHRLWCDHDDDCIFDADEANLMYPAQPAYLIQIVEDWNRRATPLAPTPEAAEGQAEALGYIRSNARSQLLVGGSLLTAITRHAISTDDVAIYAAPLPRQAAVQGEVDPLRVCDEAILAHDLLSWNRSLPTPLIQITKELYVARVMLQLIASKAQSVSALDQAKSAPATTGKEST